MSYGQLAKDVIASLTSSATRLQRQQVQLHDNLVHCTLHVPITLSHKHLVKQHRQCIDRGTCCITRHQGAGAVDGCRGCSGPLILLNLQSTTGFLNKVVSPEKKIDKQHAGATARQ